MTKRQRCKACRKPRSVNQMKYRICLDCLPRWEKKNLAKNNLAKALQVAYTQLTKDSPVRACEICGHEPVSRRLSVDHNHETDDVRGLLCFHCNYALAWFRDDPIRLRRAAEYLTRTPLFVLDVKNGSIRSYAEVQQEVAVEVAALMAALPPSPKG